MKAKLAVLVFLSLLAISSQSSENCEEHDICSHEKEYSKYMQCIEHTRRNKRSAGCEDDCDLVDCNQCVEKCTPNCKNCVDCSYPCRKCCTETCSTNVCCTRTCNNQCRTSHCRGVCKKECKDRISGDISSYHHHSGSHNISHHAKHNITTIINLQNIINNTNLIDIPIKINNTNFNNITLRREGNGFVEVGSTRYTEYIRNNTNSSLENCCTVIGPRQCVSVNYFPFTRCFHYRHKKCGTFCTSPIVHTQNQHICLNGGCHNRVTYIPQPINRCHHHHVWPYVQCGSVNTIPNCEGCYYHNSHQIKFPHVRCSRCYNDGFGAGPYYRQGPFYRPGYSHVPPCWQIGNCGYPMMLPVMPVYPSFNPMMNFAYGGMYPGNFYPLPPPQYSGYPAESDEPNDLNSAPGTYTHDLTIPGSAINPLLTLKSGDASNGNSSYLSSQNQNPRYATITIDASPQQEKETRFKRKKDTSVLKSETDQKNKTITHLTKNNNSTEKAVEKSNLNKAD